MLTCIFGPPRRGKTALMTYFAVEAMTNPQIRLQDLQNCGKFISNLNKGGYNNLTVPPNHLVYADYAIKARDFPKLMSYEIDGHKIGLPNDDRVMHFVPPYSRLFLDEVQGKMNSRERNLDSFVSRYVELHGHWDLSLTIASQRLKLVDLNVRELAHKIIEVLDVKLIKDKLGNVTKTVWNCLEFDNCFAVNKYLDDGKKGNLGKKTKYVFNGNIFNHYESKGCWPVFLHGMRGRDFDRTPASNSKFTVEYVHNYNQQHPAIKPNKNKTEEVSE